MVKGEVWFFTYYELNMKNAQLGPLMGKYMGEYLKNTPAKLLPLESIS